AIALAIGSMLAGIVLYDQLFFRPLLAWADRFRFEESQGETAQNSWLLDWGRRSRLFRGLSDRIWRLLRSTLGWFSVPNTAVVVVDKVNPYAALAGRIWDWVVVGGSAFAAWSLVMFVHSNVGWAEVGHVFVLGLITLARVLLLIALASLFWVPV